MTDFYGSRSQCQQSVTLEVSEGVANLHKPEESGTDLSNTTVAEEATMNDLWDDVIENIEKTELIAWDGCHKIYMALDDGQADWFREHYETTFVGPAHEMLETLKEWYDTSCGLRFVSGVSTNHDDPNAGFVGYITQFDTRDPDTDPVLFPANTNGGDVEEILDDV